MGGTNYLLSGMILQLGVYFLLPSWGITKKALGGERRAPKQLSEANFGKQKQRRHGAIMFPQNHEK